ncbi:hypothetical protein WJX73_009446 [Symbiochloris irregularis]|uniref:1,4-dihydroxy-2-naphthoate octaprenyltransferase n=1 Tax=Symbiochloris irregularis TaxID=706552 RepID=A0AAW1NXU1_9CHLO
MAIKPPMYSVALIPILVAAAAVYADFGHISGKLFGQLIVGAFSIIAWLNTSNDVFDSSMGVDGAKVESLVNITGNRLGCLAVANAFLALGLSLLGRAIWHVGEMRAAGALGLAIILGYMYQGPPFRLSYKGLGEPITFITFGPLSTCAFYFIQAAAAAQGHPVGLTPGILVASMLVGVTTAAILFCSHFHQIEGDKAAMKMSPLVRLGNTARGLEVLKAIVFSVYGLVVASCLLGVLSTTCLPLMLLSLWQV